MPIAGLVLLFALYPPAALGVPQYIAPYVQQHDFSGVVLVAGPKLTTYARAFDANVGGTFAVGSITKTFTAAAIEILATRGRLKYSDTLDKYIPEYRYAKNITIDELLRHSAGVPDYYSIRAFAGVRTKSLSLNQIVSWLNAFPLDFTPGVKGQYSNSGYSLLALVIERASGESYGAFLSRNIFQPFGLRHTIESGYGKPDNPVIGYDPGPPPTGLQPAAVIAPGWLVGNGSIRSTAGDLARWLDIAANGTAVNFKSLPYPLGWSRRTAAGATLLEQDGRIPGFASDISIDETTGLKVVVLSNIQCACVSNIAGDIRKGVAGEKLAPPPLRPTYVPATDELNAYVGNYGLPSLPLLISKLGYGLAISNTNDGMQLPLDSVAPGKFFFRPLYVYVTFQTDGAAAAKGMNWNGQFIIPRVAPTAKAAALPGAAKTSR